MVAKKAPKVQSGNTVHYVTEDGGMQLAVVVGDVEDGQVLHLINAPGQPTVTAAYDVDGAPGTWREADPDGS